jgi:hypothetical protein
MSSFTPLFSDIVDSSLWQESDLVIKVFMTMLAKQDRDYVVRASAYNIARWANKTEAEVLDALKVLSSPDTKRMEPQEFEGRRIERVEDGWLNLNGAKYARKMRLLFERARKAAWARENRATDHKKKRGPKLPGESVMEKAIAAGQEPPTGDSFVEHGGNGGGKTFEQALDDTRAERGMQAGDFGEKGEGL